MSKQSVYIETTIVSYLTARPSRDLIVAAHQQITREWWEMALPQYSPFISSVVFEEAAKGDPKAAQLRLEAIQSFPLLGIVQEVHELADLYSSQIQLPEKARADSYHLALATWHGMDFLVSWNCTHIANGSFKLLLEELNAHLGMRTPIICTPEELIER
jgi:hypothetical protein